MKTIKGPGIFLAQFLRDEDQLAHFAGLAPLIGAVLIIHTFATETDTQNNVYLLQYEEAAQTTTAIAGACIHRPGACCQCLALPDAVEYAGEYRRG